MKGRPDNAPAPQPAQRRPPASEQWLHDPDPLKALRREIVLEPTFQYDFQRVVALQLRHVGPGIHLNEHLDEPLTNSFVSEWQKRSNQVAEELKGRRDLKRKRRSDVLRWLAGPDAGMPYVKPQLAYLPEHESVINRCFRLRDELEWLVIPTFSTRDFGLPWRPVREVLTHDIVRAILDWKASHLDLYLSAHPHLIGGRICHLLPEGAKRQHVHEVKFSTVPFMRWYFANMN